MDHAFFIKNIEDNIFRLFNMRLELMQTAVAFLLSGFFIFDGTKSLEKLMVRYFYYMWSFWLKNWFYRSLRKQLKLGQIVVSFLKTGYFIPVKRSLGLLLMVWLLIFCDISYKTIVTLLWIVCILVQYIVFGDLQNREKTTFITRTIQIITNLIK